MTGKILKGIDYQPTLAKFNSVGEFFFEHGKKYNDKICQIDADLDKTETYSSVTSRSIRVAINLQKKGITSNDVITSCTFNTIDNVIPILAGLYLGAKIANLDPTLSSRNTKYLITLVNPRIIFVQEESISLIEDALLGTDLTPEIIVYGKSSKYQNFDALTLPSPNEDEFRPTKVNKEDISIMFFSSGTTGLPKAICHSHYSFLMMTDRTLSTGFESQVLLHFTTFYWISGMMILSRCFVDGCTRVFSQVSDGESIFKIIETYKITSFFAAPIHSYNMTSVENLQRFDVSSFKCFLLGGTAMNISQQKKLSVLFPKTLILFGYGMTEVGIISLFHPKREEYFIRTKIGSCGAVTPLCCIKIVNVDNDEILGPNEKGEIRVKSPSIMKGYYQMDASSCFDSEGYLRTGDVGYYDEDNCLYIVGRIKEIFKYKSWHIVPSIIESVLHEHPAVEESVVFGIPKDKEGEVPAACIVLKNGCECNKEEIEKFVENRVSDKEKLRGGVIFVKELPKTPTGKLIRNEVRKFANRLK